MFRNGPTRSVPTAMSRVDVVQIDIVSGRQASSSERASSSSEARASSRHGTSSRGSSTREASTRQPSRTRAPARIEDVDDLPPLPSPDFQTRRAEACRGCTLGAADAGLDGGGSGGYVCGRRASIQLGCELPLARKPFECGLFPLSHQLVDRIDFGSKGLLCALPLCIPHAATVCLPR